MDTLSTGVAGWLGEHCILHHSYFTSKNHELKDKIEIGYEDRVDLSSRKAAGFLEKDLNQQNGDCGGDAPMEGWCNKRPNDENRKTELFALMIDA